MCTSPLKGFQIGLTKNGKPDFLITSYSCDHIEKHNGRWIKMYSPLNEKKAESGRFVKIYSPYSSRCISEFTEIPCGQCIECRLKYSREWADRCMVEAEQWKSNYFVTLTYDEHHVLEGEKGNLTLYYADIQAFLKRLRKWHKRNGFGKIRFYCGCEYGSETLRPHYHMILFNLTIPDKVYFCENRGFVYYTSDILARIWSHGHVMIGDCSWQTCAYCARYVVKKAKGIGAAVYDNLGIEPEKARMSRRPGIGRNYFDENYQSIYKEGKIYFSDPNGGHTSTPSRYYDKCLEQVDERLYNLVKAHRKFTSENRKKNILKYSGLSYEQYLYNKAYENERIFKALKRTL